jgi:hypothetical protein
MAADDERHGAESGNEDDPEPRTDDDRERPFTKPPRQYRRPKGIRRAPSRYVRIALAGLALAGLLAAVRGAGRRLRLRELR